MALRPASWKGIPFLVEESSGEFGRRIALHEFPERDLPATEDLGRATRKVSITAFFIGDTAWADAQELIYQLEQPGPGPLVHPWLGYWSAAALTSPGKVRWPKAGGGRVSVDLELVQTGDAPEESTFEIGQLDSAVETLRAVNDDLLIEELEPETIDWLSAAYNQIGQAYVAIEALMDAADKGIAELDRVIETVQAVIDAPLTLIKGLQTRISNVMGRLKNPFSGLSTWKKLLSGSALDALRPSGSVIGSNGVEVWKTAGSRAGSGAAKVVSTEVLPPLPASVANWMRRELILQGVEALPDVTFSSTADLAAARRYLVGLLAIELRVASSPDLFAAISDLRVAVADCLLSLQPGLPDVVQLQTQATLPAVVLAYQANGNLDRLDDLIARNAIRHAGFVPAGKVEVLK